MIQVLIDEEILPGQASFSSPKMVSLLADELDQVVEKGVLPQHELILCSREDTDSVDISYRVLVLGEFSENSLPDWLDPNQYGEYDAPARQSRAAAWDLPRLSNEMNSPDLGIARSNLDLNVHDTLLLRLEPVDFEPTECDRRGPFLGEFPDVKPESPPLPLYRLLSDTDARVMLRIHLEPTVQVGDERLSAEYCREVGMEKMDDPKNVEAVGFRLTIDAAIQSGENGIAVANRLGEYLQSHLRDPRFVPTVYRAEYPKETHANFVASRDGKPLEMEQSSEQHDIVAHGLSRMIAGRGRPLRDGSDGPQDDSIVSPETVAPLYQIPDANTLIENGVEVSIAQRTESESSLVETVVEKSSMVRRQAFDSISDSTSIDPAEPSVTTDSKSSNDGANQSGTSKQVALTAEARGADDDLPSEARPVQGVLETYAGPTCETCGATYDRVSKAAECHDPDVLSSLTKPQNTSVSRSQPDIIYSQRIIDRLQEEPIRSDFAKVLNAVADAGSLSEALTKLHVEVPDDPTVLDSWALTFVAAVELARVGRLSGYTLHDSMTSIRDACLAQSEHDVSSLTELSPLPSSDQPILEADKLNGHRYYELTPAAAEAGIVPNSQNASLPVFGTSLRFTQGVVFGIHHVAAEHDIDWYQAPHVLGATGPTAFGGFTAQDELAVLGTVIDENPYSNSEGESLEVNPEVRRRITQQYARLADVESESLWIAKNAKVAQGTLDVLADQGLIDLSQSVYGSSYSIGQLQEYFVDDLDSEGIDCIKSVSQLHQTGD